jgi:multiple sugar transport system substrate-binding protein
VTQNLEPVISRRALVLLAGRLASLGAVGMLAACGGGASIAVATTASTAPKAPATSATATASSTVTAATTAAASAAAPAAKAVMLDITSWLTNQPQKAAYAHLIDTYAKVNPNVKVVQEALSGTYITALTARIAGGNVPDLAETDWTMSQPLGEQKVIVPLDPLLKQDKISVTDYVQVAQELGRWPQKTGSYYAWYTMFATSPLYYNTAMFQSAGLQPPDESWTWDHLLAAAQKLTKVGSGAADSSFGFNLEYFTRTLLYSYGWDFASSDLSQILVDSTDSVNALQYWQDLIYKYKVSPPGSLNFAQGAPFAAFSTKRLGMSIGGSYQIQNYRTVQGLEFDIAIPPQGPKGRVAVIKGAPAHSLPAQSPHPTEAWAFLSWWTRNQTADLVVLPGNMPSKLTALTGWAAEQQKDYQAPAHVALVYDIASKYGKPVQVLPNNTVVKKPYYTERANILANKEDAKTGMTIAAQQMRSLLQQAQATPA